MNHRKYNQRAIDNDILNNENLDIKHEKTQKNAQCQRNTSIRAVQCMNSIECMNTQNVERKEFKYPFAQSKYLVDFFFFSFV